MNKPSLHTKLSSERNKLLRTIIHFTEVPLIVLGFLWLALLILELINQSNPELQTVGIAIWIIFILDFILKFIISSSKVTFLKKNVITIVSLVVPAFRLLRIVRFVRLIRITRGLRLIKMVTGFNRGMKSLAFTMKKRAVGYVLLLSMIVVFIGAAGLYGYEKDVNAGFKNYSSALWWTAMLVMSMGTENWPVTPEGRILTFMVALYGLAVFGYITASIASFFIGRDIAGPKGPDHAETDDLKNELLKLHKELLDLKKQIGKL